MFAGVHDADSLPTLERLLRFSGARQRILAHNLANLDTPDFRPVDVSVSGFRAALGEAVDARRERSGGRGGPLGPVESDDVRFDDAGRIILEPRPIGDNILFHDGNDRDPERLVQAMVENFEAFRVTADLIRTRYEVLLSAIREQP